MAWSDDTFIIAFDAEAGDVAALATEAQKILWFNEGMARLQRHKPSFDDVTWVAEDRSVALPTDWVQLDKIVFDVDSSIEPWREWGETLVIDDPEGASGAGSARVYYWAEWTEMTTATTATELKLKQDYACLYYALSRFYKKLSSNRAYYKRYATLVGQNAVPIDALQQEADRYYQDFLEARADMEPDPPAYYYND